MNRIWHLVFIGTLAVVQARPDVGYNYPQPQHRLNLNQNHLSSSHQQPIPEINLPALPLSSQYGLPNPNIGQRGQNIQQIHGQEQNQLSLANLQVSQNSFSQQSIPNQNQLSLSHQQASPLSSQYGLPNLHIGQSGQNIQQLHGQEQNQLSLANLQVSQNSFSQQSIPSFQQISSQQPNPIPLPNLQISQNSFAQQIVPQSQAFFPNLGSQSTLNQFTSQPGLNQLGNQPSLTQFNNQPSFNTFGNQPGISQLSQTQHQVLSSQEQIPSVTKYIYVHVAPEEPLAPPPSIPAPLPPKKNYKIIFIKAPRSSTQQPIVHLPPAHQTVEEKTLIYVLVDKQHQQQIIVPTPAPTEPSKPEVYFIKYKAKHTGDSLPVGSVDNFGQQPSLPIVEDLKKNQGVPINSGESTSSLFSGGLPGSSSKYGPPGYQKRSTKDE